jgi:hypothetical protein
MVAVVFEIIFAANFETKVSRFFWSWFYTLSGRLVKKTTPLPSYRYKFANSDEPQRSVVNQSKCSEQLNATKSVVQVADMIVEPLLLRLLPAKAN